MSLRATLWALDDAPTDDPYEALVLVALADHADDDGRGCWPSHASIARRARCSVSTVQRTLARLEQGELIRRGWQGAAAEVRADRRPIVWDLNMPPRTVGQRARSVTARATTGQEQAHDRSVVTDEPRPNRQRTEGGWVGLSTTNRARDDGPTPRPMSESARETLRVREEKQAARARGIAAAEKRRQARQQANRQETAT